MKYVFFFFLCAKIALIQKKIFKLLGREITEF